jgi:DNA repair photolyase
MIISASRRTDIPAFYSDWFLRRLQEGFVLVKNPMNSNQLSRIDLSPNSVDCIVFWTKNPKNMLDKLSQLSNYRYYFQFTLNPYNSHLEPHVPKKDDVTKTFISLSNSIGSDKVIWRYDPILLSEEIDISYHERHFKSFAERLQGHTSKCMISFIDLYRNVSRKMQAIKARAPLEDEMKVIAEKLVNIAKQHNISIETCAEKIELSNIGIQHGRCIDDRLISTLLGVHVEASKDKYQRDLCGCIHSVDIGEYNTCPHRCTYCYANFSQKTIDRNIKAHDDQSPLQVGHLNERQRITDRKNEPLWKGQGELFSEKD